MSNPGPFLNIPVAKGAAIIKQRTNQYNKPQYTFTGMEDTVGIGATATGQIVFSEGASGAYVAVGVADDGDPLVLSYGVHAVTSGNANATVSLPDGSAVGQKVKLVCVGAGSADILVTSAAILGGNQIALDAIGEVAILEWMQLGASTFKWVPTTLIGAALTTV